MNIQKAITSQYLASLQMLRQTIIKCPDSAWNDQTQKNRFWHIAFHTLFFTHLYLYPSKSDFVPWDKHRANYQYMGFDKPEMANPYSKEDLLEYVAFCQTKIPEIMATINLEAESGFDWIHLTNMELQFYNIRHLQHHIGELCERLGEQENIDIDWLGMKPR